jgi:hypothetical protein
MDKTLRNIFIVLTTMASIGWVGEIGRVSRLEIENAALRVENQRIESEKAKYVAPVWIEALDGKKTLELDRIVIRVGPKTTAMACGVLDYNFAEALPGAPVMVVNNKQEAVGKVVGEVFRSDTKALGESSHVHHSKDLDGPCRIHCPDRRPCP